MIFLTAILHFGKSHMDILQDWASEKWFVFWKLSTVRTVMFFVSYDFKGLGLLYDL